jgi:hypothetical protein
MEESTKRAERRDRAETRARLARTIRDEALADWQTGAGGMIALDLAETMLTRALAELDRAKAAQARAGEIEPDRTALKLLEAMRASRKA